MAAVENVLIVGGGVAGLTLAIGLNRAGIAIEVIEINPESTVTGLGLSLQGPALRALQTLGLLEECIERGFGYSCFHACDAHGAITGTVQMPRLVGPDYPAGMGIMRQALYRLLKQVLADAGVRIYPGVTTASLHQEKDFVKVTFTNGRQGRFSLVVGADGAHSKVREMLWGKEFRPKYTGQAVWRATVHRPPQVQARYSFYGPETWRASIRFLRLRCTSTWCRICPNLCKSAMKNWRLLSKSSSLISAT